MHQPGQVHTSRAGQRRRRIGARVPRAFALLTALTFLISACNTLSTDDPQLNTTATCGTTNLALNKPATASSTENAGFLGAGQAVDGNANTRWASERSDPQWLQIDLGSAQTICGVTLVWEAAYGKAFKIQVSNTPTDETTWTTIYSTTTGTGGTQTITPTVTASGQYVRMYGTQRPGGYGYSLYEFKVFGNADTGGGTGGGGTCGTADAALNKPASASSTESPDYLGAKLAFDGDADTRWASERSDPQWLQVDLGSSQQVCKVILQWEAAYGKAFKIQVSNTPTDETTWTTIYSTTTGTGGTQTITPTVTASGQYVRMYGTQRPGGYGYSLYEFKVFTGGSTTTPLPPPPPTTLPTSDTPDFGPNVKIYSDSTPDSDIQADLNAAFDRLRLSPTAQFGEERDTFLFKPGSYDVYANLGFYTTLAGLGKNPDDVTIANNINVDSGWNLGDEQNATQNFWRSVENLSVQPQGGTTRWAVSQAAPMRRVHIKGNLTLGPSNQGFGRGFSSGGFIADGRVDGVVSSGSQQQWYTRNSSIGGWENGVWNMTFSGVQGAPAQAFPNPPYTTLATTPVTREKPYLYIDGAGKYSVFVPALQRNSSGATWPNTPGVSVPLREFYVAKPGVSAATLNAALSQGLNLFFTPGVYRLNETLKVTRPDTIVFGLGYATLIPEGGVNAMTIADVDGVKISGLLFDAGLVNSPVLLTVGETGSSKDHAADPIMIQDVYFRVGGPLAGKSSVSLVVNSDDTVIDHIWAWRGDHGEGIGWNQNTAANGLIVNGDDVLATGLFVEHYQEYQVLWNGENGKTIFYQSEMPYFVPNQAAWQSPTGLGYASYKVADNVKTHELWGGGVYCVFITDPSVTASRGFEVPVTPGVRLHSILTVSLGNVGTILNVVNDTGGAVPYADPAKNTSPRNVVSYP